MRRKQSSESAKRREVRHGIRGDAVEVGAGAGVAAEVAAAQPDGLQGWWIKPMQYIGAR
jgi:hypothetical protein